MDTNESPTVGTDPVYLQETADRWRYAHEQERGQNRTLRAAVRRAWLAGMSQAAIARVASIRRATIQAWLKP